MPQLPVQFHYHIASFPFSDRTRLKRFILQLFDDYSLSVDHVNYIFCDDDYLLHINRTHLNHDTYTDIITFPYSSAEQPILSDIYISIDRVRENASIFSVTFHHELLRVIFHGALHLCGLRDKSKAEVEAMRKAEAAYINRFLVSRETF